MKSIYLTVAILLFTLSSCKNSSDTNENSNVSIDSTSIQTDTMAETETADYQSDSVSATTDSTAAKSDVKLPNKLSTSTTVVKGPPMKGNVTLAETKWQLVELNGKAVDEKTRRNYYINMDSKSGTFKDFVGCNRISGKYFMKSAEKIGFTDIASTRKSCGNMDVERSFFNNLQKIDNYMIEGKMLHFHIGKKAVAKFEAI